ncbi:MAG TPA: branched-chain amino acid ABC transporter substrate-binding protein [Piscinibacter sp.]|jgi:ABC transporter substrate binding protein (PQQ-dependent alcohol dehydrogenase system)|uniref:branched-chain amino acid ABC transporter substrate-binding protein n=1 Tax=Piscinibacter sp. TaxID=1903157 RepID=UPI001B4F176C|nr:branched-chain amino acid ABC transporter substrate-binding protein [Piscinibacter sp.]MBK7533159.1 branched-chain amino acid ABC transporter substrate-binding protein [Piscinibacter sp.]MBL0094917.1 branched-chain amino acid ABC transporter substrate-binding protein [Piscinibacter sp.]MBP6542095.1 branched-chain amino acid ABC transporter substrate-binding protein [Piscinibacter sp.]HOY33520.1 branched-chain amino acid ABC transporter substrate-binding protein [Piscinibacter sp.]HPG77311.1
MRAPALALALALATAPALAATLKATLLIPADDSRLERSRAERAYLGHPTGPAGDGVQMAVEEGQFELDAAQAGVAVTTQPAASLDAARAAALAAEKAGAAVLLVDLPTDWLLAVVDAVKLPVLNLSDPADRLRAQDCRARLFHLMPSERMRADALAQTLVSRKWTQLLLLVGPSPADQLRAATVQASMKRYGLKAVASKPFRMSADPRERDLANPLLLTAGANYDAVWVVDSDGEFARSLPYRTVLPRPVVGDAGLVAVAWHAQFERFGAPQVSRRFAKATRRPMTAHDWSAWMAGKALVGAAVAAPKGPNAAWAQALAKTPVDGSKGTAMTFRAWDGQLRQTLLLTDGQGVISQAPIEGLLHPSNVLDTLGADAPEKLCKAPR